jgi:hypothetical protein
LSLSQDGIATRVFDPSPQIVADTCGQLHEFGYIPVNNLIAKDARITKSVRTALALERRIIDEQAQVLKTSPRVVDSLLSLRRFALSSLSRSSEDFGGALHLETVTPQLES